MQPYSYRTHVAYGCYINAIIANNHTSIQIYGCIFNQSQYRKLYSHGGENVCIVL